MLYIVGLGLGDERDITLRGLDAVQKCEKVYLEAYTSLLALGLDASATTTLVRPAASFAFILYRFSSARLCLSDS